MNSRIAIVLLLAAAPLSAQAVPSLPGVSGTLAFDARATLGDFTGRTTVIAGSLVGAESIAEARGWVEAPARSLVTGNGRRDRDMYKVLEVERFPTLRFELDGAAAGAPVGDSMPVTLRGRFTIHGVTRSHGVAGWLWLRDDSARFRGQVPLDVKDYGVEGLSKAFGLLKMDEEIVVRMDLTFTR